MKIYLVGGAVRDEILGRQVKDHDWVVVGATPEKMLELGFDQVGADFPVFLHPKTREEYALARVERKTGAGYHGFSVSTENVSIEDDLGRRDLTINSIAKDVESGEYVDPFGGLADIKSKILRHTSPAFSEDPLRVIRLARFAARYTDFKIAGETWDVSWALVHGNKLNELSIERFWAEMQKGMSDQNFWKFVDILFQLNITKSVEFFRMLWGGKHRDEVVPYAFAASRVQNPLDVFIALTAFSPNKLRELKPSSDAVKLASHVERWRACGGSPKDIHDCIKATRGFNATAEILRLIDAIIVAMASEEKNYYTLDQFVRAWHAAKRITAADIDPSLKGEAIGRKLEELRLKAIEESLGGRRNE
jgi:tRNA nucleotidyltransferase (CCA-adding enzyme)